MIQFDYISYGSTTRFEVEGLRVWKILIFSSKKKQVFESEDLDD